MQRLALLCLLLVGCDGVLVNEAADLQVVTDGSAADLAGSDAALDSAPADASVPKDASSDQSVSPDQQTHTDQQAPTDQQLVSDQGVKVDQSMPPLETADLVFSWSKKAKPTAGVRLKDFATTDFWTKAINCGGSAIEQAHKNSTGVDFGVTTITRFPAAHSVYFYSDRNFEAKCNQHITSHRAEMHASNTYSKFDKSGALNKPSLGIEVGSPGSTVWIGWSEYYPKFDFSNFATLMQYRSCEGTGSPAVALEFRPDNPYGKGVGIILRTKSDKTPAADNYVFVAPLKTGVWQDFVVEIRYSYFDSSGHVKVWHRYLNPGDPQIPPFDYQKPTAVRYAATLWGDDATCGNCSVKKDSWPHIRWGLYRHSGSTVPPAQIPAKDRVATKYLGPVRIRAGSNLGASGLQAVLPRPALP